MWKRYKHMVLHTLLAHTKQEISVPHPSFKRINVVKMIFYRKTYRKTNFLILI